MSTTSFSILCSNRADLDTCLIDVDIDDTRELRGEWMLIETMLWDVVDRVDEILAKLVAESSRPAMAIMVITSDSAILIGLGRTSGRWLACTPTGSEKVAFDEGLDLTELGICLPFPESEQRVVAWATEAGLSVRDGELRRALLGTGYVCVEDSIADLLSALGLAADA